MLGQCHRPWSGDALSPQLLSYCHKGKDTAWPSIQTLNKRGDQHQDADQIPAYPGKIWSDQKVIKRRNSSGGYEHNLYQLVVLDKERVLLPPKKRLPEESEEVVSGIAEDNLAHPKSIDTDEKKSLKRKRIIEELKKLKLDKNTIAKIIFNHSLEDIEEKLDLLGIKRNVINPAGSKNFSLVNSSSTSGDGKIDS